MSEKRGENKIKLVVMRGGGGGEEGEERQRERGKDILDGAEQANEFLSACGEAEAGGQEVQGMGVSWLLSGWWDHRE